MEHEGFPPGAVPVELVNRLALSGPIIRGRFAGSLLGKPWLAWDSKLASESLPKLPLFPSSLSICENGSFSAVPLDPVLPGGFTGVPNDLPLLH